MTTDPETVQPCCDYRDHNSPCGCDCPEHPIGAMHPNGWPVRVRALDEQLIPLLAVGIRLKNNVVDGEAAPLTFDEVSQRNHARASRWHPGFPEDDTWTLADWSNAMCGEAGEAANVVKKLRRAECGLHGALDKDPAGLLADLADEIADVFCYLDLLATKAGIDLPAAIQKKFNEISDRQGFPEKIREVRTSAS